MVPPVDRVRKLVWHRHSCRCVCTRLFVAVLPILAAPQGAKLLSHRVSGGSDVNKDEPRRGDIRFYREYARAATAGKCVAPLGLDRIFNSPRSYDLGSIISRLWRWIIVRTP